MRNVLIIGAGDGVGRATAEILNNENLLLVDNVENNLKEVAGETTAKYFVCDIASAEELTHLKTFIEENFSGLDTIINCAGIWTKGELSQLSQEHFAKINSLERIKNVIDTNTFGTIAIVTMLSQILIKNGKGQIINVNSQSGVETESFCPVYNASKHGSYYYRKAIQNDLARHNIKITDVCPGLIKTNFYISAEDELPDSIMQLGLEVEDVAKTIKFVFDLPHEITIPSIEVRNIKNY